MLSNLKQKWRDYGFEITLGFCVVFIIFFGLYRKIIGAKGTWSRRQNFKHHFKPNFRNYYSVKPTRQPPR